MRILALILTLAALLGLGVPSIAAEGPALQDLSPADALARQTALMRGGPPDLTMVFVARLKLDEQQIDVTSLNPRLVAQVQAAGGPSYTVFSFSKDRKSLELFSRDPATGGGKLLVLPVAPAPVSVTFPVIADGKLVPQKVTLLLVVDR